MLQPWFRGVLSRRTVSLTPTARLREIGLDFVSALGAGRFAAVYKATWSHQTVAVKRMLLSGATQEFTILQKAAGSRVVAAVRLLVAEPWAYLVLDLCHTSLQKKLFESANVRLTFAAARKFSMQLAEVLVHLSVRCIAHRDIKPDNIAFRSPPCEEVVLLDFNLAAVSDEAGLFHGSVGAVGFAGPEVHKGLDIATEPSYGVSVDVFSAGVVMKLMMSGCGPRGLSYPDWTDVP
mmetsp:Transcript_57872/g.135583  ORF Transcript_57872/g.135583 Transcript_57872/m.135583 type:complete len:235 (+) Transcript_57872:165-869(+)